MSYADRAIAYAQKVVSGKISAGEYVVMACQRQLDDLDTDFAYIFDDDLANRVCRFIESLPHTKGRWAKTRELIKLEDWQCFFLTCVFGWVSKETGYRRFREAYLEVPRKNGKSIIAASVGLYCAVADREYGAEVYSGATTEKQAWEVFRPARLMAQKQPAFKNYFGLEVNAKSLFVASDGSRFEPLIGNPGDGSSPSCAIVDEYHEHKNSDLYDTMMTGMGSREQPLMLVITTAGSNMAGPCYEKRVELQKILKGVLDAERTFGVIYSLDEGDDWKDPESWTKANPNLGISLSRDYIEAQVAAAVRSPTKQNSVKTKHFNLWVGAKSAWLNMEHWNKQADDTLCESDFYDLPSWEGLDLATKLDIAARVSLFVRQIDGQPNYFMFPTFYLPEDALESSKNAKQYQGWAAQGYLSVMEGAEIDFKVIQDEVLDLRKTRKVSELVYDPWQATQLAQAVRAEGVEAVEYRNTVGNLSPPMRELEAAIASGRLHHPDNPVLNWMASNVVAKSDAKDNIFPRKELPDSKIDGIVAGLFALGRAMHSVEESHAYQTRGFSTL
jgi:phage terminase large subunit-like protein